MTNYDGRKFATTMKGFDRVLLDSPCSGLGVISRDPSIKAQKTYKEILKLSHLQKELLLAAIDCTNHKSTTGGYIVYSTCSISVEENEAVVDFALKNRYVKLVETGVEIGTEGLAKYKEHRFHPSLKLTKRIYPHTHNMDGFFFAKFKKFAHGVKSADKEKDALTQKRENAIERNKEKQKEQHKKNKRDKKAAEKAEGVEGEEGNAAQTEQKPRPFKNRKFDNRRKFNKDFDRNKRQKFSKDKKFGDRKEGGDNEHFKRRDNQHFKRRDNDNFKRKDNEHFKRRDNDKFKPKSDEKVVSFESKLF